MAQTKTFMTDAGPALADDGKPTRTWAQSHGMYLAGRSVLDEADAVAAAMEAKWGCGRLRLLVGSELREKFDRQRYLLNRAIWHGDLEDVRREAPRMVKAWNALDRAATEAGAKPLDPKVWEVTQPNGRVAAIVQTSEDAHFVVADGRKVDVYTLEEIARLLEGYPGLSKIKHAFPGASVVEVRKSVADPLDAFSDSRQPIDEPLLDDEIPF
jgi:hypothetical protein